MPTVTYTPTLTVTSTFTPTATSTLTPTNTPQPTSTLSPTAIENVVITDVFYDGTGDQEPDEYVEIRNDATLPVQLNGWTLRDEAGLVFTFPNFVLQPGQVCRVGTNEEHPEWCGFNYDSDSAIWDNDGDCAYLLDSAKTPIDTYCY